MAESPPAFYNTRRVSGPQAIIPLRLMSPAAAHLLPSLAGIDAVLLPERAPPLRGLQADQIASSAGRPGSTLGSAFQIAAETEKEDLDGGRNTYSGTSRMPDQQEKEEAHDRDSGRARLPSARERLKGFQTKVSVGAPRKTSSSLRILMPSPPPQPGKGVPF